jgi:uncharacterized membrane-anchored protein YjiN (DUF445 family)
MFSSNQEVYNYIDALIQRLNEAGETGWALELKDAMRKGSTGNEVLGDIWLKLKEFLASKTPARLGMQDEIARVTKDLGKTLRRWR